MKYMGIDIETTGTNYQNEIISIGYWVTTYDESDVAFGRINLELEKEFDPKTLEQFWSKHQDILAVLQEYMVNKEVGIKVFKDVIDTYDDLVIVSDNPCFDIGFINHYLATLLQSEPLTIDSKGNFRLIHDSKSYYRGLLGLPIDNNKISTKQVCDKLGVDISDLGHDHLPENDAEYIIKAYLRVSKTQNRSIVEE